MTLTHPKSFGGGPSADGLLEELVRLACSLGASDARIVSPEAIVVEDALAEGCREPRCPNYGLAPSCPPHVGGPSGFRELQRTSSHAVAIRISVPSAARFSSEQKRIMRRLHMVAAGVERFAIRAGFVGSKAFAGGSCKTLFCHDHPDCPALSDAGACRFPESARPSMSGFGVDVSALMRTCGWPGDFAEHEQASGEGSMSWVAGLVLIRGFSRAMTCGAPVGFRGAGTTMAPGSPSRRHS